MAVILAHKNNQGLSEIDNILDRVADFIVHIHK